MTEEERRRCIILGICGGGGGAQAPGEGGDNKGLRREALRDALAENGHIVDASDEMADYILGLIDEARGANGG